MLNRILTIILWIISIIAALLLYTSIGGVMRNYNFYNAESAADFQISITLCVVFTFVAITCNPFIFNRLPLAKGLIGRLLIATGTIIMAVILGALVSGPIFENVHPSGKMILAQRYLDGDGVPKDAAKAASIYQNLANQGITDAQSELADLYFYGKGVPKNLSKAAELYEKAANQGDAIAAYNTGVMYANTDGIQQDYKKAAYYYQMATEQNNKDAQNALAKLYLFGKGVPKDYTKGFELTQKAAEQGLPEAQYNLGVLYEHGWGTPKDQIKADEWFKNAEDNGYKPK